MSTLATSGALPIIRYICVRQSYSIPCRVPASVDHIYYNKYNRSRTRRAVKDYKRNVVSANYSV